MLSSVSRWHSVSGGSESTCSRSHVSSSGSVIFTWVFSLLPDRGQEREKPQPPRWRWGFGLCVRLGLPVSGVLLDILFAGKGNVADLDPRNGAEAVASLVPDGAGVEAEAFGHFARRQVVASLNRDHCLPPFHAPSSRSATFYVFTNAARVRGGWACVADGWRSKYPAEHFRAGFEHRLVGRLHVDALGRIAETWDELTKETAKSSHWRWTGAKQPDGRAVVRIDGSVRMVTRVLWKAVHFQVGADVRRVVHRTCDEPDCVNPWHAELVKRGSWQVTEESVRRKQQRCKACRDPWDLEEDRDQRVAFDEGTYASLWRCATCDSLYILPMHGDPERVTRADAERRFPSAV
jgi:hypothetical protein